MTVRDLLPPPPPPDGSEPTLLPGAPTAVPPPRTRREARVAGAPGAGGGRVPRRAGPLLAGAVVLAAAATGGAAALLSAPGPTTKAEFPAASGSRSTTGTPSFTRRGQAPAATQGGRGAAVAPSAESGRPAARRISDVPDRADYVGATWPALTYTLEARGGTSRPPVFPSAVPGFARVASSRSTVTVEAGRYFHAVGGLPVRTASYAVCRQQRFFTRWMVLDPSAGVEATLVDEGVHTAQNKPVRGTSGWMSSYGCVQPALRVQSTTTAGTSTAGTSTAGTTTAVTVLVETQVWRRR